MKSIGLRGAVEVIGIIAIVASLVFVGLELRQSQRIAIAGQYQDRAEHFADVVYGRLALQSAQENLARRAREVYAPTIDSAIFDSMSDEAIAYAWSNAGANLTMFDNNHFQYQLGFMSEEGWQSQRRRLSGALRYSQFMRAEMLLRGDRYRDTFRQLANELIAEIVNEQ